MNLERWILIGILLLCVASIIIGVPKEKARDACVLFLFLQVITWVSGLFVAEMGWIEYPTQLFPKENDYNKTSFVNEFVLFPIVSIFFSLYYPEKVKWTVLCLYYIAFAGIYSGIEVVFEKFTTLVKYHGWKWYWTIITIIITLFLNHKYYLWFRKRLVKVENR